MRLTAEGQAHVEGFLGMHLGVEGLRLPPVFIHCGRTARVITGVLRVGAITLGAHVFVAPSWVARDRDGGVRMPGWLAVHELVHVVQFRRAGAARFLWAYLSGYVRAFGRERRFRLATHRVAYQAIAQEVEAYGAEEAYRAWPGRVETLPLT